MVIDETGDLYFTEGTLTQWLLEAVAVLHNLRRNTSKRVRLHKMTRLLPNSHGCPTFIRVIVRADGIIEFINNLICLEGLLAVVKVIFVVLGTFEVLVVVCSWFVC